MRIKYGIRAKYYHNEHYHKRNNETIIQFEHYQNNKYNGEVKEWYKDGQIFMQCNYKNNKLNGEVREWYSNGQLKGYYHLKNDKLNGEYIEYNNSGIINKHTFYKNDNIVKGIIV